MSLDNATAPPARRIQIDGGPSFTAASDDVLLRAALRAGLSLPYECNVGGCGGCRFELLEGEMATLWEAAPGLSERERKRGKRLACQSQPLSDCRIRVRLDDSEPAAALRPQRVQARLLARRPVTPDMTEFTFGIDGALPDFWPGQYALLHLPGVPGARAYSLSNLANGAGQWQFVIRRVPGGRGSAAVFDLPLGAPLELDGPYGHAHLRASEREVVCIAGGSGLGPMLSVARGALAESAESGQAQRRIHFFLGLRTQAELGAAQEVQALADPRLTLHTVLSSPEPQADGTGWTGATGWIHAEVERVLGPQLDRYDFYFAGPPPMVEALQDLLMVRHRVPFGQIHFDRFC